MSGVPARFFAHSTATAPFPHPAIRTGRADFPHPALLQNLNFALARPWLVLGQANPEGFAWARCMKKLEILRRFVGFNSVCMKIQHPNARRFSSEYQKYEKQSHKCKRRIVRWGSTETTIVDVIGPS